MSSALVRQALSFVDPEENEKNSKNKHTRKRQNLGQERFHPYKSKNKKGKKEENKGDPVTSNIKKLLALSAPARKTNKIAETIVKRAIKGKPLLERIEKKVVEEKSILFPEDDIKDSKNKKKKSPHS